MTSCILQQLLPSSDITAFSVFLISTFLFIFLEVTAPSLTFYLLRNWPIFDHHQTEFKNFPNSK